MPISPTTLKRLFAKSDNRCAMPRCTARLVVGETLLVEICHIRARRKGGPRYDPNLSESEKNEAPNLLLLCPTCHTLADKDTKTYTVERLLQIKREHEARGSVEFTPDIAAMAERVIAKLTSPRIKVEAKATQGAAAVAIGRDNYGSININTVSKKKGLPANSIGADANLSNYIEYLCGLYVNYTAQIYPLEGQRWAMIGKSIKQRFLLKTRTRDHIPVDRFHDLVRFLIDEKLAKTPVGRAHLKRGTKLCRTFEEFRHGAL